MWFSVSAEWYYLSKRAVSDNRFIGVTKNLSGSPFFVGGMRATVNLHSPGNHANGPTSELPTSRWWPDPDRLGGTSNSGGKFGLTDFS